MRILKSVWGKWQKIAKKIGHFQALIIFSVFYFLVLWIVGIFISFLTDPLNIKKNKLNKSNFIPWLHEEDNLKSAQKPY